MKFAFLGRAVRFSSKKALGKRGVRNYSQRNLGKMGAERLYSCADPGAPHFVRNYFLERREIRGPAYDSCAAAQLKRKVAWFGRKKCFLTRTERAQKGAARKLGVRP